MTACWEAVNTKVKEANAGVYLAALCFISNLKEAMGGLGHSIYANMTLSLMKLSS